MSDTHFNVKVVTPKGTVAETAATGITAPGELGELEILPGHVPALVSLRAGVLTLSGASGQRLAIAGGYLRISDSIGPQGAGVEVLVEQAVGQRDVSADAARAELQQAETELAAHEGDIMSGEWANIKARVDWAQARLDVIAH